jgi:hypothetical protein
MTLRWAQRRSASLTENFVGIFVKILLLLGLVWDAGKFWDSFCGVF